MDWISKPYWLKVGLIYASILVLSSLLSYIPILNLIIDLIRTNLLPASFLEHPIRGFYQAKFVTLEPADYISSYNIVIFTFIKRLSGEDMKINRLYGSI